MGDHANFYNSRNGDRVYSAESFEEFFKPFYKNGVFNNELQVVPQSGMDITVNEGNSYINGKMKKFEGSTSLTIEPAHATLNRIDNVVVRRDDTERDFYITVVKGENGVNPTPPEPVRNLTQYDIVIARIQVNAAMTNITASNIQDTRMNDDICGWVRFVMDDIDYEQIYAEFLAWREEKTVDFNEWFETIKGILDGETAGHLQNEIDAVNNRINTETEVSTYSAILTVTSGTSSTFTKTLDVSTFGDMTNAVSVELTVPADITEAEYKQLGKNGTILTNITSDGVNNMLTFRNMKYPTTAYTRVKIVATYQGV